MFDKTTSESSARRVQWTGNHGSQTLNVSWDFRPHNESICCLRIFYCCICALGKLCTRLGEGNFLTVRELHAFSSTVQIHRYYHRNIKRFAHHYAYTWDPTEQWYLPSWGPSTTSRIEIWQFGGTHRDQRPNPFEKSGIICSLIGIVKHNWQCRLDNK